MSKHPNIIFIFTDQQRSTALGCAGVEDVRTPHLDRFATQGVRFTNAVSNTPTCAPARATILTRRHAKNVVDDSAHEPIRTDLDARTAAWLARTGDTLESSEALADRCVPEHRGCVAPMRTHPRIRAGDSDPALRRYRSPGTAGV